MIIGEVEKNAAEKIRVSTETYKGYEFLDVRVYFEDDTGEWRPTRKGVTVPPAKAGKLIELLQKGVKGLSK